MSLPNPGPQLTEASRFDHTSLVAHGSLHASNDKIAQKHGHFRDTPIVHHPDIKALDGTFLRLASQEKKTGTLAGHHHTSYTIKEQVEVELFCRQTRSRRQSSRGARANLRDRHADARAVYDVDG